MSMKSLTFIVARPGHDAQHDFRDLLNEPNENRAHSSARRQGKARAGRRRKGNRGFLEKVRAVGDLRVRVGSENACYEGRGGSHSPISSGSSFEDERRA